MEETNNIDILSLDININNIENINNNIIFNMDGIKIETTETKPIENTENTETVETPEISKTSDDLNNLDILIPNINLNLNEEIPLPTKDMSIFEKMILLFDIDGTICEHHSPIDQSMSNQIRSVKQKYNCDLGVVSAGNKLNIDERLGDLKREFRFIFSECGSVVYDNDKLIKRNLIRKHKLYNSNIQRLMKHSLRFISESNYEIGGHFIDIRDGLIYISLVGLDSSFEMKEHFKKVDKKMEFRKRLLLQLNERKDKNVTVVLGGESGITIYPSEWDKIQILQNLKNYQNIHYFGDSYEENGNDYRIINHEKVFGYRVDSLDDTRRKLDELLNY